MFEYTAGDDTSSSLCRFAPHSPLKGKHFNLVTEVETDQDKDVAVYVLQCSTAQESLLPKLDFRVKVCMR